MLVPMVANTRNIWPLHRCKARPWPSVLMGKDDVRMYEGSVGMEHGRTRWTWRSRWPTVGPGPRASIISCRGRGRARRRRPSLVVRRVVYLAQPTLRPRFPRLSPATCAPLWPIRSRECRPGGPTGAREWTRPRARGPSALDLPPSLPVLALGRGRPHPPPSPPADPHRPLHLTCRPEYRPPALFTLPFLKSD